MISADQSNGVPVMPQVQDYSEQYDSNDERPCWDLIHMLTNHPELRDFIDTTALYKKCEAKSDALQDVGFEFESEYFMPIAQSLVRDGHRVGAIDLYSMLSGADKDSRYYHISEQKQRELHAWKKEKVTKELNRALKTVRYVQLFVNCITGDATTSPEEQQAIQRIQNYDFNILETSIVTSLERLEQETN
jgi:hypothetical protein